MSEGLDHLLDRLRAAEAGRPAPDLEAEVMRGVARFEAERRTANALAPLRLAAVGLALAVGLTAGGLTAAHTLADGRPAGGFSVAAELAPSTLLGGGE